MRAKLKIPLEAIQQAQCALADLPEHRSDEFTKSQAIQRLLPQIRAAQNKGYRIEAIGKVLTERGIPVTTGALRAYVSGAAARSEGKKKRRRAKQTAESATGAQVTAPEAVVRARPATPTKATEALPRKTNASSSNELDWDPAARSEKFAPSGYGSFVPRPDTDIKDL